VIDHAVAFQRRGRVGSSHIGGAVVSTGAIGYVLAKTLHHQAPLTAALIAAWAIFCLVVVLNLSRLVYLVVDADTIRQRRYFIKRRWARSAVGGLVRVDIAYPGAQGQTIPTIVLVGHSGEGIGLVPLINWTPDEITGVEHALGVPVSDQSGGPVTTEYLSTHLPGSMDGLAPYVVYFELAVIGVFILFITVVITIGVLGQH
jgi:hypothetical protein